MRRLIVLPYLLAFAGGVAAQTSHFGIVDIQPTVPPAGGDVLISFSGSLGDALSATVDGVKVPVHKTSTYSLTVTAPRHARGPAVLKVGGTTPDTSATATLRYVTNDDYERVLIPILINDVVPGANGSRWTTEVWAWNASSEFLDVFGNFPILFAPAPPTPPPLHLVPDASQRIRALPRTEGDGALLLVPRWSGRSLTFNARFADASRQASTGGTEVPLVRESAFAGSQLLLNVPSDKRFSVVLRVYTLNSAAHVRVRAAVVSALIPIIDPPAPNPLLDVKLDLPAPSPGGFFPGFAQLPIVAYGHPLQMTITSADPMQKIWAFAVVTHNDSQNVTLVTPQ